MSWSVLQSQSVTSATLTATTPAFTSNLSSGTKLIAYVSFALGASISTVKDSNNNSFTQIVASSAGNQTTYIYVLDTPAGDVGTTPTVTATCTGSATGMALLVQEVSGLVAGTACLDGTPGKASANATTLAAGGTAESVGAYGSVTANEFLVLVNGDSGDTIGSTGTTPTGYTPDASNISSDSNDDLRVYYTNSTGGTESPTSITCAGGGNSFDWNTIFVAFKIQGVVYFDALGPSVTLPAAVTTSPVTWTHVNSGNCIIVGVADGIVGATTNQVISVSYGGTSLNFLGYVTSNVSGGGNASGISVYGLVSNSLPQGSNTVSVAFTTGGNGLIGGSISLTGVGSLGTVFTNNGSSATPSVVVTGTTTGGMIVANEASGTSGTETATTGTLRYSSGPTNGNNSSGAGNVAGSTVISAGGGASTTASFSITSDWWSIVAVEALPSVAPSGPTPVSVPFNAQFPPTWYAATHRPGQRRHWLPRQSSSVIIPPAPIVNQVTLSATVAAILSPASQSTQYLITLAGTIATIASIVANKITHSNALTLTAAVVTTAATQNTINHIIAAVTSATGLLIRQISKGITGVTATTGSVPRSIGRNITGTVASVASVTTSKVKLLTLAAVVAVADAITRTVSKKLPATSAATGNITRQTGKNITGLVVTTVKVPRNIGKTVAGTVATVSGFATLKVKQLTLTAVTVATGNIKLSTGKIVSATATVIPATVKQISKTVSTPVVVTAVVKRGFSKTFTAVAAAIASVTAATGVRSVTLSTVISVTGNVQRKIMPILVAPVIINSGITRTIARSIQGTLVIAGQTTRRIGRVFTATTVTTTSMLTQKVHIVILNATVAATGSVKRAISVIKAASVVAAGNVTRFIKVKIPVVAAAVSSVIPGRPHIIVLVTTVSVSSAATAKFIASAFVVTFKYGVMGVRWVLGQLNERWKTGP